MVVVRKVNRDHVLLEFPAWRSGVTVSHPLLPESLGELEAGDHLIAVAHLGASHSGELAPESFERAPEPDPNDGLT